MKPLTYILGATFLSGLLIAGITAAEDAVAPPPDSAVPAADTPLLQADKQQMRNQLSQRRAQWTSMSAADKQARRSNLRRQMQARRGQPGAQTDTTAAGNP